MTPLNAPDSEPIFRRWARPGIIVILTAILLAYVAMPRAPRFQPPPLDSHFLADFPAEKIDTCLPEGSNIDDWNLMFTGFGCNAVSEFEDARWLHIQPKGSTKPGESHSALALKRQPHGSNLTFACDIVTMRQLRTGAPVNPWETGWVIWGFRDLSRFYYFTVKMNGWELGKLDPTYKGHQRFLASGADVKAILQKPNSVLIVQQGPTISVSVDGKDLAIITDTDHPYLTGKMGVYCEDADALFGKISSDEHPPKPN